MELFWKIFLVACLEFERVKRDFSKYFYHLFDLSVTKVLLQEAKLPVSQAWKLMLFIHAPHIAKAAAAMETLSVLTWRNLESLILYFNFLPVR